MPSASPSPVKRPSLTERTSSTHSLSSSGKQATAVHKIHRPHVVGKHSRNVSHGKNLSKLNKVHSSANVTDAKIHQRKRSGASAASAASGGTPGQSPKSPGLPKRNSSHVNLPKNLSHGNLRKNHSATILGRNTSHTGLKRLGLPPTPKQKPEKKTGFFELGDQSSGEEEEGEWEDSTTQSPELTRNNSKASTPARVVTPNGERLPLKSQDQSGLRQQRTSSPPSPSLKTTIRSLPNLRKESNLSPSQIPHDPALLHQNGRSSRAPPAMSTVSAVAGTSGLTRSESSKSFTQIDHPDGVGSNATPGKPLTDGPSSAERPVSRFLSITPGSTETRMIDDGSDEDSANFMSNYKPLPSESPEKSRALNKSRFASIPSRTQQKLELQRRETMRAGGGPTTPPSSSIGLAVGSALSLHSRSGSRGRNRSFAEEMKAQKVDYETGIKQLTVVRRFRNPILESLKRMKASGVLPAEIEVVAPSGGGAKSRPQKGQGVSNVTANGPTKAGVSRSLEDKKPSPLASRSNSRGRGGGRVHFQRQGSHDDIGVTPSQESPDGGDEEDGVSPEQALMRRIWNSREVFDAGEASMVR
jgi:hypothetical protein